MSYTATPGPAGSLVNGQRPPLRKMFATGSAWLACGFGSASLVVVCVPVISKRRPCGASWWNVRRVKVGPGSSAGNWAEAFCGQICSAAVTSDAGFGSLGLPGGWV